MIKALTLEQRVFINKMKINFVHIMGDELLDHPSYVKDSRFVTMQTVLIKNKYDNGDRKTLNWLRELYVSWIKGN